ARTRCSSSTTHHQAEYPNKYRRISDRYAPRVPPRLCTTPPGTECDHPGSAGDHVASTSVNHAASAANRIQRASRSSAEMRVCRGEGPLRVLREARGEAVEIRGMRLIIIGHPPKDTYLCPRPNTLKS